jgi:hypothetical protein
MKVSEHEIRIRFHSQHAVATKAELRLLGQSSAVIRSRIASGFYVEMHGRVVAVAAAPHTPEQALLAACLAGGRATVASHQSAAWLWNLVGVPSRHSVTVPRGQHLTLSGVDIHHPMDSPSHIVVRRRIPCTDPFRTLVDLASVAPPAVLDGAIDRALATQLVTIQGIEQQLSMVAKPGRRGSGRLRGALVKRGLIGAPGPSVLESRVLRLLRQGGITPLATEVWLGELGRYRVDVVVQPRLIMETDGYAFHFTPEQKAEDERRRNRLRLEGNMLLVYTWQDVTRDGRRVLAELWRAMATVARAG